MVLVDEKVKPRASWEFDADIAILTHSTTIQPSYQAVIHCEIIRQAARVIAMDTERLRSGDRAIVRFRFLQVRCLPRMHPPDQRACPSPPVPTLTILGGVLPQRPEYLNAGSRFVFREGKTKGIGVITSVH